MSDVCLIVIFNHRYDKNIPILEGIYKDRFSNRYYLVPFYDGVMENVIPVYGRSIFFESYIAQGTNVFYKTEYKHYLFIADDMMICPEINENNYKEFFEVKDGQSWIPALTPLHEMPKYWIGTMSAFLYRKKQKYIEAQNEFMPIEKAHQKMALQGVNVKPLSRYDLFKEWSWSIRFMADKLRLGLRLITWLRHPLKKTYELEYPMVGSYSDILLVSGDCMKSFAHYCGVFGATCLFVEIAIPTALILSSNMKIVTEKNTKRKGKAYWFSSAVPFWEGEDSQWDNIERQFKNLKDMMERFPEDQLYIHPVKLSKWVRK